MRIYRFKQKRKERFKFVRGWFKKQNDEIQKITDQNISKLTIF